MTPTTQAKRSSYSLVCVPLVGSTTQISALQSLWDLQKSPAAAPRPIMMFHLSPMLFSCVVSTRGDRSRMRQGIKPQAHRARLRRMSQVGKPDAMYPHKRDESGFGHIDGGACAIYIILNNGNLFEDYQGACQS